MKDFFRWLLGETWKAKLFAYSLGFVFLLLLPSLYFGDKISFDRAKFTEEWSKIIVTLSLLYIILEYQKFSTEKNKSKFEVKKLLKQDLLMPLEAIVKDLENFEAVDIVGIKKKWNKFYRLAKRKNFAKYPIDFLDDRIYTYKEIFELRFVNNFFLETHQTNEVNIIDLLKVKENLSELSKLFKETYSFI